MMVVVGWWSDGIPLLSACLWFVLRLASPYILYVWREEEEVKKYRLFENSITESLDLLRGGMVYK
jgi:hypothetical protein